MEGKYRKFVEECKKMSSDSGMRATIYIHINNFINIFIIVCGCVIGFINVISSDNIKIISAIMGFSISLLKGFQDMFKFPSKSILLKSSSLKLKKLMRAAEREIQFLDQDQSPNGNPVEYLNTLYKQKEAIEMEVFRALIISSETDIGSPTSENSCTDSVNVI